VIGSSAPDDAVPLASIVVCQLQILGLSNFKALQSGVGEDEVHRMLITMRTRVPVGVGVASRDSGQEHVRAKVDQFNGTASFVPFV